MAYTTATLISTNMIFRWCRAKPETPGNITRNMTLLLTIIPTKTKISSLLHCKGISLIICFVSSASLGRWSVTSPPHPQGFEISEEEGHFTVSYLAKQLERNTGR